MASKRIGALALLIALAGWAAHAEPNGFQAGHDLEIDGRPVAAPLDAAATIVLPLEIRNQGSRTWSGESGYAIAYHWFDADGRIVEWDGVRTPLIEPVRPGESRIIEATLEAPRRSGIYSLQWDVVQEGELWVSEVDPTPVAAWPVTVIATHAFSVVRATTPRVLMAGGRRTATVEIRNDGVRPWPVDGSISLAPHWFGAGGGIVEWEGRRTPVRTRVEPGETVVLKTLVEAPARPGRLELQWDMVEEGVCWFSERDATPEPMVTTVVVPAVIVHPGLWSILVLAAAVWVVVCSRRASSDGRWELVPIFWCVLSIIIKQAWVLGESGEGLSVAGFCLSASSAIGIGLLLVALPRRVRFPLAWVTAAVVTFILFADLIHLRFFGDLGSIAALRSAGQVGQVGSSVMSLFKSTDIWFWSDLLAALVMVPAFATSHRRAWSRRPILTVGAVLGVVLFAVGVSRVDRSTSLRQVFQSTQLARQIGVLNLHCVDAGRALKRDLIRPRFGDADFADVVAFFADRRGQRAGVGPHFGAARDHNLVMIQVESLQAFVVGLHVGGREVTPVLNSLATESFTFANVTDQTEEGRSSDSELTTQVSLLPPDRGAAAFMYADNRYTGLAKVLAERGYTTLSAVPFEGAFWNRRSTHPAYGYDRSLFVDDFDSGEVIGWGLNDRDFLSQVVDRLVDLPQPWCAYLLTLSLHHPFDGFPEHLKQLDVGDWEGTPFGNYLHTMHHFDRALADFLSDLERGGLAEKTVIVLWGDHDAGFEWGGEIASVMGATHDPAGWYLSQQVPLIIHVPGVAAPVKALTLPAGHADAAPTVLGLLGVDAAPYPFIGRNLLGAPGTGPVVGEYRCWRDATHLYLRRGPELGDGQCIDLATMNEVGSRDCATGFEEALRQVEISRLVLEHDLQQRLGKWLADHP